MLLTRVPRSLGDQTISRNVGLLGGSDLHATLPTLLAVQRPAAPSQPRIWQASAPGAPGLRGCFLRQSCLRVRQHRGGTSRTVAKHPGQGRERASPQEDGPQRPAACNLPGLLAPKRSIKLNERADAFLLLSREQAGSRGGRHRGLGPLHLPKCLRTNVAPGPQQPEKPRQQRHSVNMRLIQLEPVNMVTFSNKKVTEWTDTLNQTKQSNSDWDSQAIQGFLSETKTYGFKETAEHERIWLTYAPRCQASPLVNQDIGSPH